MCKLKSVTLFNKLSENDYKRIQYKISCLFTRKMLLVIASLPLLFVGHISTAMAATIITEVTVLGDSTYLRIEGEEFGGNPTVNLGNYVDELVFFEDCTLPSSMYPPVGPAASDCVVVELPGSPSPFPDGDYLLWLDRDNEKSGKSKRSKKSKKSNKDTSAHYDLTIGGVGPQGSVNVRSYVDIDCSANPDVLVTSPYLYNYLPYTTYYITGRCNGPLYIVSDGVRFVGVDGTGAAIVLPAGTDEADTGAIFVDGAHDVRIEKLLLDASAWADAAALGSDAAGLYARNAFVRIKNSRIVGGEWGVNPFRQSIIRFDGINEITGFIRSGLSVGMQSVVRTNGQMIISSNSTVTGAGEITGAEVYRMGIIEFKKGVTISLPAANEAADFYSYSISASDHGHVRIRDSGTVDLDGILGVYGSASIRMQGGVISGTIEAYRDALVDLRGVDQTEGEIDLGRGSVVEIRDSIVGSVYVNSGSVVEIRDSDAGPVSLGLNSTAGIRNSSVEQLNAFLGSAFSVNGGDVGYVEVNHGSAGSLYGVSVNGNIVIYNPSSFHITKDGTAGDLNWNTIYECGNDSLYIEPAIAATGYVIPGCPP